MTTINDGTKFSTTVLVIIVGVALYVAKVDFQANATASDVSGIQKERASEHEKFEKLFTDVEVMKNDVKDIKRIVVDEDH